MNWKIFYIILAIWLITAVALLAVGFGIRFAWFDVSYVTFHAGEQKTVSNFGTGLFCSQLSVTAPSVGDKFSAALLDSFLYRQTGLEEQQFRRPWHVYVEPGSFKTLTFRLSQGSSLQLAACSPTLIYLYTLTSNDDNSDRQAADARFVITDLLRQQRLEDTFAYQQPLRIWQQQQTGGCRAGDEQHLLLTWDRVTIESRPKPSTVYVIMYAPPDSTRQYYGDTGRTAAHVMLESKLSRALYDTTHALHRCDYTHHCVLGLSLLAAWSQRVVVQLMDGYGLLYNHNNAAQQPVIPSSNHNNLQTDLGTVRGAEYDDAIFARTLTIRCAPRIWFYLGLFGLIPAIILALVTAFMLRFRGKTIHAVPSRTTVVHKRIYQPGRKSSSGAATNKGRTEDVVVYKIPATVDDVDDDDEKNSGGGGVSDSGVEVGGGTLTDDTLDTPRIPPRPWKSRAVRVLPDMPPPTGTSRLVGRAAPPPIPKKRTSVEANSEKSVGPNFSGKPRPPLGPPPALPQRMSKDKIASINNSINDDETVVVESSSRPSSKFVVNDQRWSRNLADTSIRLLPVVVKDDNSTAIIDEMNRDFSKPMQTSHLRKARLQNSDRNSRQNDVSEENDDELLLLAGSQHASSSDGRNRNPLQQPVLTTEL